MMITIKNFNIWSKEITIDDNGNEITINKYEEVSSSDYKTVRYFSYKGQGYLFVSNMVYQCQLVYSVKEIDKTASVALENHISAIKCCEENISRQELSFCKAIDINKNIEKCKEIYFGTITHCTHKRKAMNEFLEENFAI